MATGWKPKKSIAHNLNNVFPISYKSEIVDFLIKELYKKKWNNYEIVYLGKNGDI